MLTSWMRGVNVTSRKLEETRFHLTVRGHAQNINTGRSAAEIDLQDVFTCHGLLRALVKNSPENVNHRYINRSLQGFVIDRYFVLWCDGVRADLKIRWRVERAYGCRCVVQDTAHAESDRFLECE